MNFYSSARHVFETYAENAYFFLLWVVLATLPFSYVNAFNSTAMLVMGGIWLLDVRWKRKVQALRQHKVILLYVLFYGLYLLGMTYTANTQEGLNMLQRLIPLLAFPLILGTIPTFPQHKVQFLFATFTLSCLLATFISVGYALYRYYLQGNPAVFYYDELSDLVDTPAIYFAVYLGFCLFWLTERLLQNHLSAYRKVLILALMGWLAGIFLLLIIRTAITALVLTYCIGLPVYFFRKRHLRAMLASVLLPLLLISVVLTLNTRLRAKFEEGFSVKEKIVVGQDKDHSLGRNWGGRAIRVAIWECAATVIPENLLTGVGTGDVQDELQKSYYKNNFLFAAQYNEYNAHNQFIETQLAIGLPGTVVLLLLFGIPLYTAIRTKNYLYLAFLLFVLANCLTESLLGRQKGAVFFGVINALLLFHQKPINK